MTKKTKKRKINRRTVAMIGAAIIALLVVIGIVGVLAMLQTREQDVDEDLGREKELEMISSDADQAVGDKNNIEAGLQVYDEAIKTAENDAEKAQLIAAKATLHFNKEQYDQALALALDAEKVDSTSSINALIAQIYEAKQDMAKAAEYYRLAAAKINKNTNPLAAQDKAYYEARATELSGH